MKISIRSTLLIVVYFAICALNYVTGNVGLGWGIVVATAIWFATASSIAFRERNSFAFGFSTFGSAWLAIILGFSLELPSNSKFDLAPLRGKILHASVFFRETRELDRDNPPYEHRARKHDLYTSGPWIVVGNEPAPNAYNTMKIVACWSSLAIGLIGGASCRCMNHRLDETAG